MSNIYELSENYRQVFEAISNGEDDQVYLDTLEAINDSIEEKADNYMRIIKNLEGDNEALDKEIKRLQARKKTNENGMKRMKEDLQLAMEQTNKLAFKTPLFSYGIQNNAPSLDNLDIDKIPKKYFVDQEPKLDKKSLLNDLKEGQEINGATMKQTKSLRVR
ncbi:hypothetical protein 9S3_68 [uncultured Caudovirales phage]|uniref:Siphovirus Gp157 n=1 Tax=uncultured Caudovirales phage TaxID=2100421 RepID=A0A2H4J2J6_9CAUD|nr:hypothetical protein 9S3_68 [uncultured Caudovirales phage]